MAYSLTLLSLAFAVFPGTIAGTSFDSGNPASIKEAIGPMAKQIMDDYKEDLAVAKIPGIFEPHDDTLDSGTWAVSGYVWAEVLEYGYLTGDNQFNELVASGMLHQVDEDFQAFMPRNQTKTMTTGAQTGWGLTALTAAELNVGVPKNQSRDKQISSWRDVAIRVFETQVERWSDVCKGGLRDSIFDWGPTFNEQSAGSNGNLFLLSARLAQLTGNKTYSDWAEKTFQWCQDIGLVKDSHVYQYVDAFDPQNCSVVLSEDLSYHAIFTEASAIMYNITNGADKWKSVVSGFANSSSIFITNGSVYDSPCIPSPSSSAGPSEGESDFSQGIYCSPGEFTVGAASRSYAHAIRAAPQIADKLQNILNLSAVRSKEAWEKNVTYNSEETTLAYKGIVRIARAYDALGAVQSLLWKFNTSSPATATNGKASSGNANGNGSGNGNTGKSGAIGQPKAPLGLFVGVACLALYML